MNLPKARTRGIVVQDLGTELLVYDLQAHKAYTLNETSKIVFEACGGAASFVDLKHRYKFTDDLIHLALAELKANDLLADYESDHFAGLSRREAIRRVGSASMIALPVIAAMTAPSAVHAASGARLANNSVCTTQAAGNSTECQSGICVETVPSNSLRCCATQSGRSNTNRALTVAVFNAVGDYCANDAQNRANSACCSGQATPVQNCTQNSNEAMFNFTCL